MDAAAIQAKINRGAGIAARYLGTTHTIYRPRGIGNPLARANSLGTILADFKADFAFEGARPNLYGKAVWGGLFDRTLTREGDYLVGDQGTFFVAAQQLHAPTACIQCNQVLTAKRPTRGTPGDDFYGGDILADETALMTSWPASVLHGTKGDRGDVGLPGDARLPWWAILLPAPADGPQLMMGDVLTDAQAAPRRYIVSSAERTDLGWRISAMQVGA